MLAHYYRELLNFCLRTLKDRDAAADVVQESYARVIAIERSSVAVQRPRALLYQVARHVMLDGHRRAALRDHDNLDGLPESRHPDAGAHLRPDAVLDSTQGVQAYLDTIESLPPRCRQAFVLHVFDGLPRAEIARQMGTSVSMVEKHIARGRLACRECERRLHGLPDGDKAPRES